MALTKKPTKISNQGNLQIGGNNNPKSKNPPDSFTLTRRFITFEIPVIFYYQQVDLPGLTDLTF